MLQQMFIGRHSNDYFIILKVYWISIFFIQLALNFIYSDTQIVTREGTEMISVQQMGLLSL